MQRALIDKAEELLKADNLEEAFPVLFDLYQYESLRAQYEPMLLAGICYCMTFKMQEFGRAEEILNLLTADRRVDLDPFYIGLLEKAAKAVEEHKKT